MRSIVTTAALLLTLGACHVPPPAPSSAALGARPLRARIIPTGTGGTIGSRLMFHVNRPAYVALFEIHPGAGISLVHPGFGTGTVDGLVHGGLRSINPRRMNREQYRFAGSRNFGPRYFFMVASEQPLNLERVGMHGYGLPRLMGSDFASFSAFNAMETLARLTIPNLESEAGWTTDFFVDWPQVVFNRPGADRVMVTCNGYRMYVPAAYMAVVQEQICNQDRTVQQPTETPQPDAPQPPADSTDAAEPGARPPLPAEPEVQTQPRAVDPEVQTQSRAALLERVTSSSQLGDWQGAPHLRPEEIPMTYGGAGGAEGFDARELRRYREAVERSSEAEAPRPAPAEVERSRPEPARPVERPEPVAPAYEPRMDPGSASPGGSGAHPQPTSRDDI